MVTDKQCYKKYGPPELEKAMVLWDVPSDMEIGVIPKRIYCNRDLVAPLQAALRNVISRGLVEQLKTWDGCFNIRQKRGSTSMSLHAWGLAIDINASWNRFGRVPTLSAELVACFTDAGLIWGGEWSPVDGMHFQLREI